MIPQEISLKPKTFITMKVDLNVSAASKVMTMGGCPKYLEQTCGIQYRQ